MGCVYRRSGADPGGDLFHDNKPSRGCLYRTMDLIRQYTMGSGEAGPLVVSDQACFARGRVNYEDPNLNVECPFFMIHGNHDDPGGESNLCAANLLEVAGLCNYFGRHEDLEDIVIRPLLLTKGRSQVAIYGLGNIRDERLHRAFQARKVRFETPVDPDKWFHVMILHQNRHKGSKSGIPSKSCIHEEMLPSFLDLVIWGHEHDCQVKPQESLRGEFYVIQPGSSVATSLTPGEAGLKHVALIDLRQGNFRCNPVPLWTVRPLVMRDIVLSETGLLKTDTQAVTTLAMHRRHGWHRTLALVLGCLFSCGVFLWYDRYGARSGPKEQIHSSSQFDVAFKAIMDAQVSVSLHQAKPPPTPSKAPEVPSPAVSFQQWPSLESCEVIYHDPSSRPGRPCLPRPEKQPYRSGVETRTGGSEG
eukprot:g30884.t1